MNRPTIYDSAQVQESCATLAKAGRKAFEYRYQLAIDAAQLKLLQRAVQVALLNACDALDEESHASDEIQPDIDAFNLLAQQLKLLKSSRKGTPNDGWRGDVL